tara:strand:- start:128 stop:709 length:582 start_codon:yes stop_codon:yes gene_type:complete
MAEWEIANILQAMSMEQMINKEESKFQVKTFALNKDPIKTIGGLSIIPDLTIEEVKSEDMTAILLPGAENWSDKAHSQVIENAIEALDKGILVCAICGATLELANRGVLDNYRHTSNSLEYLNYFSERYKGHDNYINQLAVADRNLVTASVAGGLDWAKLIIERLGVYPKEKVENWYAFFNTGKSEYYMSLIS